MAIGLRIESLAAARQSNTMDGLDDDAARLDVFERKAR